MSEVGSGLNFTRPKFLAVVDGIVTHRGAGLVKAHKDRLVRFGCELLVPNTETLRPEEEMVQDVMTITHCFRARLSGLRHDRDAVQQALHKENVQP